jgi:glycosyltransferase involved in cell wall biosynthesis
MRVLVLTPYLHGIAPGPRSSIELWERVAAREGFRFDYAPFETEELRRLLGRPGATPAKVVQMARACLRRGLLMADVADYDAVLVYREAALIGPAVIERWVARRRKPIIYQLDDPLYVPYRSPFNGYLSYLKCFGKVSTLCRLSQVVIVNSSHHYEYASRYNRNVRLIPSLVDGAKYRYVPRLRGRGQVCVGWSGSPSTAANLELIAEPLKVVASRVDTAFHFIGSADLNVPGLEHTAQAWRADTEVGDLRQFDVGLLPLPDNSWNRRKFNMKLAQYMTLGIPPVCSPLGDNVRLIQHGTNGLLARSRKDWAGCVSALVGDPDLREAMSGHAAAFGARHFTLQANEEKIVTALKSAFK